MPTTPPHRPRRRLGHLVVAAVLALIGLGLVAWIDHHFAKLGWGPGDVLRAQFRGTGGIDCPCEFAAAPLLPGEGLAAGLLVLASGCLGFAFHAHERAWRRGFGTLGASSLVGALLASSLVAMPAFDPRPWPAGGPPPGRPAVLFFHAQWCSNTSLFEWERRETSAVRRARQGFALYEADLTDDRQAAVQAMYRRWDVKGIPTTLFLDEQGQELPEYRLNGFERSKAFARRLRCVRAVLAARSGVSPSRR